MTFLLPLVAVLLAASPKVPPMQREQQADADLKFLRDLAETRSFHLGRPERVQLTPDGSTVVFLRALPRKPELRLFAMDVKTAQVREGVTPEQISRGEERLSPEERARPERMRISTRGFTTYELSQDGKLVLVTLSGAAYVVPLAGGAPSKVAGPSKDGAAIFDPKLSPDGASVSFVRGGELWVANVESGAELQITSGATETRTHAQAEFIAQEEQGRFTGYWWSPDSKWLVYEEADLSPIEKLYFGDPAHPEVPVEATRYPRPGKANARLSFAVVSASGGGKPVWIQWDKARFEYVPHVSWQEGGQLTLLLLTRDQKDLSLVAADPKTGAVRELLREHDDAWLNADGHPPVWLRDGSRFLWETERNGAWALELHRGEAVRALIPREWGYAALAAVAPDLKSVIVERSPEPVERQLWTIPLEGGAPVALTHGPDLHAAIHARESPAHVLVTQPFQGPPRFEVFRADGSAAGELPSVAEKPPFSVRLEVQKLGPGPGFWTAIVRPHSFDPQQGYPV